MFKLFNRPEVTVKSVNEVIALKQFFDGKKHFIDFADEAAYNLFMSELIKQSGFNNLFSNKVEGDAISASTVSVEDLPEDIDKDEIIEKEHVIVDDSRPSISMSVKAKIDKDGIFHVEVEADKELQNYWNPDAYGMDDPDDELDGDDIAVEDTVVDESDVDEDSEI